MVGVLAVSKYKAVISVFWTFEDTLRNIASNFMFYGLFAIHTNDRTDSDDTFKRLIMLPNDYKIIFKTNKTKPYQT